MEQQINADAVRFEGEPFKLGGKWYIIPSLSTKRARQLWPKIRGLNQGITEETLPEKHHDAVEVIHAAISRNYPDVTFDEIDELVDMNNMKSLLLIVSGQSGLSVPGRAPAGTSEGAPGSPLTSTGETSTEASSSVPAGPSNTSTT
jgi:hypothetical protein